MVAVHGNTDVGPPGERDWNCEQPARLCDFANEQNIFRTATICVQIIPKKGKKA
jgi:hypothetical protein